MYLFKLNREARALVEIPDSEFHADPACYYFYVQAKRVTVPTLTAEGFGEIVWQHPDWKPPVIEVRLRRRPLMAGLTLPKLTSSS